MFVVLCWLMSSRVDACPNTSVVTLPSPSFVFCFFSSTSTSLSLPLDLPPSLPPLSLAHTHTHSLSLHKQQKDDDTPVIPDGSENGFAFLSSFLELDAGDVFFGDVVYERFGVLHLDAYLGCCLFPRTGELDAVATALFNPVRDLIKAAGAALVGRVVQKSAITGANPTPIPNALVEIRSNAGGRYRPASVTRGDGRFVRLLQAGSYTITVSADGYASIVQVLDINEQTGAAYTFELSPKLPPHATTIAAAVTTVSTERPDEQLFPSERPATPAGFSLVFQGRTPYNTGAALRFATAFDSERQIGDVAAISSLQECADACDAQAFCRGFVAFVQNGRFLCAVLSDLGEEEGIPTSLECLSYARNGAGGTSTTADAATVTTTATTTAAVTTTTTTTTTRKQQRPTKPSTKPPEYNFDTSVHPVPSTTAETPRFTAPPPAPTQPTTTQATGGQGGGGDDDDDDGDEDDVPDLDDLECSLHLDFE